MVFYEITLKGLPQLIFAHEIEVKNYKNKFRNVESFIELATCDGGNIVYEYSDGRKNTCYPGMTIPVFSDMNCRTYAENNEPLAHTTVGVRVEYSLKRQEGTSDIEELKRKVRSEGLILIPFQEQLNEDYPAARARLRKIAKLYYSENPANKIKALSEWFSLAAFFSEYVITRLENMQERYSPFQLSYVSRVQEYIAENYRKKLTVEEISNHLGISQGYLHRIFKAVKRMSVVEYINSYRVDMAIQLVQSRNLSLRDAASLVGIEDEAYMSRLFKKVTGLGFRDYFKEQ